MSSARMLVLAVALAFATGLVSVFARDDAGGSASPPRVAPTGATATAIFAGGCFWCVEADFEKLPGVVAAESGYIGGRTANPSYHDVSAGGTGHAEAVRVTFDPAKVSYAQLVEYFWRHVDPTVKDRQFCDTGSQYRTAIFPLDDAQKAVAVASKAALEKSGRFPRIYTEIEPAGPFTVAEEYHQDYYRKNPLRYRYYRTACGRDARVAEVWGTSH